MPSVSAASVLEDPALSQSDVHLAFERAFRCATGPPLTLQAACTFAAVVTGCYCVCVCAGPGQRLTRQHQHSQRAVSYVCSSYQAGSAASHLA